MKIIGRPIAEIDKIERPDAEIDEDEIFRN